MSLDDYTKSKKEAMRKHTQKNMIRITTYMVLVISTIGIYPSFQIIAGALVCTSETGLFSEKNRIFESENTCFSLGHFINIFEFLVLTTIYMFIMRTATMTFFDPNPLSRQPYARMVNDSYILRTIPSIFIPIFSVIDFYGQIRIYTLVIFACVLLLEILLSLSHPPHYFRGIGNLIEFTSSMKLGIYFSLILNYYVDNGEHSYTLIYSIFWTISLNLSIHQYKKRLQDQILSSNMV